MLYTLAFDIVPLCGELGFVQWNLTKVRYEPGSGLKALWQAQLGCREEQVSALVFPFSTANSSAPLTRAHERVLVVADELLMLDGETGELLYNRSFPNARVKEVARVGDGSSQQLVLYSSQPNSPLCSLSSFHLGSDANWTLLATASVNESQWRPVESSSIVFEYESRGRVWPLQSVSSPAHLLGIDSVTGKTAWSSDNDPLLTGHWAAALPGYTAGLSQVIPHPIRPDWLLVSAEAHNASGFVISAFSLLDSTTGKTLHTAAHTAAVYYGDGWSGWEVLWTSSAGLLFKHLLAPKAAFYIALNAQTLRFVSMGEFTATHSYSFVGADAEGASIVYSQSGKLHGERMPAFDHQQAAAARRSIASG